VTSKDTPSVGEPELEQPLLNVLEYVKATPQSRVTFVRQALNDHFDALGRPPRLMNYVSDLNWVYVNEPWEDALWFRYFWEKEHQGEPWPIEAER
jgi:hypothetical protein